MHKQRIILALLLTVVLASVAFYRMNGFPLRGTVMSNHDIAETLLKARAGKDSNSTLSVREIRFVLIGVIRDVILGRTSGNINSDSVIDRDDIRMTVSVLKSMMQPSCGNGITEPQINEQCDDGNTDDTDVCRNNCTFTPSPF
jgi:cysteine-rich repeat protein